MSAADAWSVPLVGVALGVVLGIALWLYRGRNRRREELAALAALNRWTYTPDSPDMIRRWRGAPFGQGAEGRATEVFTGNHRGHHFAAFTYSFEVPGAGGRGAVRHVFSVYALSMGGYLPMIEFTPAGGMLPNPELGGTLVPFSSRDFSWAWAVTSVDQRFAYGLVHPGLTEWLMSPRHQGLAFRIEDTDILHWRPGRLELASIMPVLDLLIELGTLVPNYVWNAYRPL